MNQKILIARDTFQTLIAIVEDGRLVEYFQEPRHLEGLVGNIYVGRVKRILPGMESAFVDIGLERDGFLYEGDMGPAAFLSGSEIPKSARRSPSIKDFHDGERILIQVSKEPMGSKGARLTTQISLPGNYLIFMPFLSHLGVSRRIEGAERRRLRELIKGLRGKFPCGFIVRTAAEGADEEEIAAEMQNLAELWTLIQMRAGKNTAPILVHQEIDAVGRSIREVLLKGGGSVITDEESVARRCRENMRAIGQDEDRVELWDDPNVTLFDRYHVEQELDKALKPRVWLSSGGCIVIQPTEALVAVDVNSGRYVGRRSLEDTAFAINMEAADEIIRQLRLRGLGGIIVMDFIDMIKLEHREKLIERLNENLQWDRAKSRILGVSEFGLVEMTRRRKRRNLDRVMTATCPCCEGRGRVTAPWRVAQNILGALRSLKEGQEAVVTAGSEVNKYFAEHRERLALGENIVFEEWPYTPPTRYDIRPRKMKKK